MKWFKKVMYLFIFILLTLALTKIEQIELIDVALYIGFLLLNKAMLDWSD